MIEKLLQDHVRLKACAAVLGRLVDGESAPDITVLADARWALGSTMMQHIAFEDRHLYAKLMQDDRAEMVALGQRFHAELSVMFSAYAEHAKSWTPDRIVLQWAEYRAMARAFLNKLLDRIDREECELFPAVRDAGIETHTGQLPTTNWTREAFAIKDSLRVGLK